jgi:hypothetical protein
MKARGQGPPPAAWIGLFWVYTGLAWLAALFLLVSWGWTAGALAVAVRLAATLGLGVGMAATERWAWAAGVCLSAFYAVTGTAAAGALALALLGTGGAAPWAAVGWGLTVEMARRAFPFAAVAAVTGALTLRFLWRDQGEYNVPHRRAFTTLTDSGVLLALPILMTDIFLLYGWWSLTAR